MTRRRKKHRPGEIVAKLRDSDAMLNASTDLAAMLQDPTGRRFKNAGHRGFLGSASLHH
jgi:hypothetical protein